RCTPVARAVYSARSRYRLIQYRLSATRESMFSLPLACKSSLLLLVQNPCVLAAAALRRIDHQRSFAQRHSRQTSRNDRDLVAVEHVGAQIHVPRLHAAVQETRRAGQLQRRLSDIVARIGGDA